MCRLSGSQIDFVTIEAMNILKQIYLNEGK